MAFSGIIGQKGVIDSLMDAFENKTIGHAYLFEGPNGIGKRTVAQMFANMLICDSSNAPCGNCKSCVLANSGSHPDIKQISSDTSIGVDVIRDIAKGVLTKPYYNKTKVYIIENAEKMTVQAQNSLLKTLEEPPDYVTIILTTANISSLLPTIISRCMIKKFVKNKSEEVEQFILNKYPGHTNNLKMLSSLADGIIGNVEKLIKSQDIDTLRKDTLDNINIIIGKSKHEVLAAESFFSENKEKIDLIFEFMLLWLRDILILKDTNQENFIINSDSIGRIIELARAMKIDKINKSIYSVLEAKNNLLGNANFNLTIENMILKINN